jgi:hypothetical protein
MFTNFFAGQAKPVEQQASDILDVIFQGILTERERARRDGGGAAKTASQYAFAAPSDCRNH